MEIKQEVKTIQIDYKCDDCINGKLIPNGITRMVFPPLYEHKCDSCDCIKEFNKCYPYFVNELK